ncbi:uncharacterized protein BDV14DRAFT_203847 [Aspergillus stella-maris]|uniref:uncharacterized protein n=1 Tax=Aspergillus stella-maris TaxID=1810926 RepID=UPI003CCC91E8
MEAANKKNRMTLPVPKLSLRLYRRCVKGRKQLFSESDTASASYFVTNPVPHKHSDSWKPVFYRGDNPKYNPETSAIGRARRSGMWGSFRIWIGDGVKEVLENDDRRRRRRSAERKNKWRKRFSKAEKAIDVEEEQAVRGKVVLYRMRRAVFFARRVDWEFEGVCYRWTGTRMFARGALGSIKGWSHSMKLVRIPDHALIATFEKNRVASRKTVRTGIPPNKSKTPLGILRLYDCPDRDLKQLGYLLANLMAQVDAAGTVPSDMKDNEKDINPDGAHSGNLTEEAIIFSCWVVVEAEHRLRAKIPDFLEEVAENMEGG